MRKAPEFLSEHLTKLLPDFQRYQFAFTAYLRDPQGQPRPPGAPLKRINTHKELLRRNLESFILAPFPVLRKVLGKRKWDALIREFFIVHRCHTPIHRQVAEEFLKFLRDEHAASADDPPWLYDLAHYEWVELALMISNKDADLSGIDRDGDLLRGRPALNPALFLLTYSYAVQRIGPQYKPSAAQQETTRILAFRDLDFEVRFVVLNAVSARLLALLQTGKITGEKALQLVSNELKHPNPEAVLAGGLEILQDLRRQQAILGASR